MNRSRIEALVDDLEHHPDWVQLHYTELEKSIAWAMDEVYKRAQNGEDDNLTKSLIETIRISK